MDTYQTLGVRLIEGVAVITLSREEIRNAINVQMVTELNGLLNHLEHDDSIKVIVFTGAGNTFISGGDLEEFMAVRGAESYPLLRTLGDLLNRLDAFPKPTIAMINGTAIGGGCEFAGACHFRFASEKAVLGFVQIGMHITTGWGGGSRLLEKLPESQALTLLLTGERIGATRARELGFVDAVYEPAELEKEVVGFARKIAAQPLRGIQAYLRLLAWKRCGIKESERVEMEIEQCSRMWGSDEHLGVVQRFLDKGK